MSQKSSQPVSPLIHLPINPYRLPTFPFFYPSFNPPSIPTSVHVTSSTHPSIHAFLQQAPPLTSPSYLHSTHTQASLHYSPLHPPSPPPSLHLSPYISPLLSLPQILRAHPFFIPLCLLLHSCAFSNVLAFLCLYLFSPDCARGGRSRRIGEKKREFCTSDHSQ